MVLVDSNIILDIFTGDSNWFSRSSTLLQNLAEEHRLFINPIIYSEISISFDKIEDLDSILNDSYFEFLPITREVAFLAGKSFLKYRKKGGTSFDFTRFFYWSPCGDSWNSSNDSGYFPL